MWHIFSVGEMVGAISRWWLNVMIEGLSGLSLPWVGGPKEPNGLWKRPAWHALAHLAFWWNVPTESSGDRWYIEASDFWSLTSFPKYRGYKNVYLPKVKALVIYTLPLWIPHPFFQEMGTKRHPCQLRRTLFEPCEFANKTVLFNNKKLGGCTAKLQP